MVEEYAPENRYYRYPMWGSMGTIPYRPTRPGDGPIKFIGNFDVNKYENSQETHDIKHACPNCHAVQRYDRRYKQYWCFNCGTNKPWALEVDEEFMKRQREQQRKSK